MADEVYKNTLNTLPHSLHPTQHLFNLPHHQHFFNTISITFSTATMQFTIVLATLLSLTSAAAVTKRQSGVCGALSSPLCCQLDVLGVANLNCETGNLSVPPLAYHGEV
jgi:hypothetical protein